MSQTPSLFSLSGKVALITGASRGIGYGMVMGLAEAGADICLLQRDISNTSVQAEIRALGRMCHIVYFDASDHDSVKTTVSRVLEIYPTFDIVVSNAGICRHGTATEYLESDWDSVLQVNLKAVWELSRAAAKHFLDKKKPGKIISTASILSYQGGLYSTAYSTSKGGLAVMTKALSNEWACHGICVNAIAPGYVSTDMTENLRNGEREPSISCRIPCGRWGTPDDFKGPVVFLASRASDYVHGELLVVDGGWLGR
ncbi:2-deoxy-D-gluconate 3-dehydrogenase [Absidia repens]|uniref:2-deoxy-D-gluconate 3-dehydrogenase n=1 Tax=Absidia repens TaxID=90262 RepID=A0A1X2IZC3_9FUNG|nr:2-deoxy-D-gluconate 3-dehydrogenase [Absidia repens]